MRQLRAVYLSTPGTNAPEHHRDKLLQPSKSVCSRNARVTFDAMLAAEVPVLVTIHSPNLQAGFEAGSNEAWL